MTTLKQLVTETSYNNVWECLKRNYKDMKESSVDKFQELYERFVTILKIH